MGAIFNSKVLNGVSVAGKTAKGLAKKGVVFWELVPSDYILSVPFQNSIQDVSGLNSMVAGNGSTNAPTYAVGRKGVDFCAVFDGAQSVKTVQNLTLTHKVSVSFWINTSNASLGIVSELTPNFNGLSAFGIFVTDSVLSVGDHGEAGYSTFEVAHSINQWKHLVIMIDRIENTANSIKIFIDGTLQNATASPVDNKLGYASDTLYIGQRGGNSLGIIGKLQDFKVYNRILTADEITALYYE